MIHRRAFLAILTASGIQSARPLCVQSYFARPIRLVPFPPGGLIARQLSASFGPIVVDNRPGAGSGRGPVLSEPPDQPASRDPLGRGIVAQLAHQFSWTKHRVAPSYQRVDRRGCVMGGRVLHARRGR